MPQHELSSTAHVSCFGRKPDLKHHKVTSKLCSCPCIFAHEVADASHTEAALSSAFLIRHFKVFGSGPGIQSIRGAPLAKLYILRSKKAKSMKVFFIFFRNNLNCGKRVRSVLRSIASWTGGVLFIKQGQLEFSFA